MKWTAAATFGIALASLAGVVGCSNASDEQEASSSEVEQASTSTVRGAKLFFNEKFDGNGRTCGSCHGPLTGTINPAEVAARLKYFPKDPLFKHDAADQLGGNTFERLKTHATIIVNVPLHPNVKLVGSNARTVALNRGVPTTMNIGLDPVLMLDGREPTLQSQARGAILGHAQSSKVTNGELNDIAAFEKTLFNRKALKSFASGGGAPTLPQGITAAQKRGRVFFTDDFAEVQNGTAFRCVHCHSGPMLNQTSPANELFTTGPNGEPGIPVGTRFSNVGVAEFNVVGNPVREYDFKQPDGTTQRIAIADPGRALITGSVLDVGSFKIGTLWGAKDTAPYFHNNSAKTLRQMVQHYKDFTDAVFPPEVPLHITDGDVSDITAYMELL